MTSRLEADPWLWGRLALAAAADVASAAAVAYGSRGGGGSGEWLRSEAFLSQVCAPSRVPLPPAPGRRRDCAAGCERPRSGALAAPR